MTKGTKTTKAIDATTMPGDQGITLPMALVRDTRLPPEALGAYAIGLAFEGDPRPLPRLLEEEGRMRARTAQRLARRLVDLGYVKRVRNRGPNGRGYTGVTYTYQQEC